MSGIQRDDRELNQPLSEAAELERLYRQAAREEPSAAVDEAIRAAGRRAVHARPTLMGSAFSGSWRVPMSIAAVLVLSVTLTLVLWERGAHLPSPRGLPAPPAAASPRVQLPETDQTSQPPPAPAVVPPELGERVARKAKRVSPSEVRAERDAGSLQEAPAPAPRARQSAESTASSQDAGPRQSVQAGEPPVSQPSSNASVRHAPEPGTAAFKQETETGATAGAQDARLGQAGPRTEELASGRAPPEQRGVLPQRASPRAVDAAAAPASARAQAPWEDSEEAWLKHVDELRNAGRLAEAHESYVAFRLRYPDYRLPAGYIVP